jgi:antirestriction protein ArdC
MPVRAYEEITSRIISIIEQDGTLPWRKPWVSQSPRNLRGNLYRGINRLILSIQPYSDPRWLTFNQVSAMGGRVRKGQRGTPILLWKEVPRVSDEDERSYLLARCYHVFSVEQTEGLELEPALPSRDSEERSSVATLVASLPSGPKLRIGSEACYSPTHDVIIMPRPESFVSFSSYEQTLAHELTHATGHATRLNRPEVTDPIKFGSMPYAREELVAELGASFVCSEMGIPLEYEQSAAYVKGWLSALKGDKSLIVRAAGAAQVATDYLLAHRSAEMAA